MNTWQAPPRILQTPPSDKTPSRRRMKRVLGFFNLFLPERSEIMEIGGEFSGSYYDVLGVGPYSSLEEIRRAYRKLAMKWHPDRWTRRPSMFAEAKRKFQIIQEAYEVLSDDRKRVMYNAGMYDPSEEENEGLCDFVQEMMSLMAQSRAEKQEYSLEDLQHMLVEMARGFDFPQWPDFEMPTTTHVYLSRPDSNCIRVGGGTTTQGTSHHLHESSAAFRTFRTSRC